MISILKRFFCALAFESLLSVQNMKRDSMTSMFKGFFFFFFQKYHLQIFRKYLCSLK